MDYFCQTPLGYQGGVSRVPKASAANRLLFPSSVLWCPRCLYLWLWPHHAIVLVRRRIALLLVRRLLLIRGEDRLGDGQSAHPQVRQVCAV